MDKINNTIMWNPWHGCHKVSTGCLHCYMYNQDESRGILDSNIVKKTGQFNLPLKRHRDKTYFITSDTRVMVCMTSDFFVEEADEFREKAWEMMKFRKDVLFMIPTKRPERVINLLPTWWRDGLENVWLNVSAENQEMADSRIPILIDLPFKHKGIMASPLLENINIEKYLSTSNIDAVSVAGENYTGARPFKFEWAQSLQLQCKKHNTTFELFETGSNFIKDNRVYNIPISKQKEQALKAGLNFYGRKITIKLESIDTQEKLF